MVAQSWPPPAVRRQGRGPTSIVRVYWIPVFGFAETGTTSCGLGLRGRVLTTALGTNGPRVALRLPGVTAEGMWGRASFSGTAEGMRGRSSLSEVIPAAGEAGEPGAIGTLGRCEAASPVRQSRLRPTFAPASPCVFPDEAKGRRSGIREARCLPLFLQRFLREALGSPAPARRLRAVRGDEGRG